ncbi:GatB/YqeY domain-containing protein [Candidatus Parcubacteria bacterium]|nr:MAG: GatB/YqeY domain-containing protein [Candidatus Parcubacteria bacterium]
MGLQEKINEDLKEAQRSKDELRTTTLRMLIGAFHNKEIEKRTKASRGSNKTAVELEKESRLNEEEMIKVVQSELKKRKEAIESFEKGGREDLVAKEKKEMSVLEKYVPEQISEEKLKAVVLEEIKGSGAKSIKEMGAVIKRVSERVGASAEGSRIAALVKSLLQ